MSYEFKGYDWLELAECWGISTEDEDALPALLREYMKKHVTFEGVPDPGMVSQLRDFVSRVRDEENAWGVRGPLLDGLLALEDDSFVEYCGVLLEHLWT